MVSIQIAVRLLDYRLTFAITCRPKRRDEIALLLSDYVDGVVMFHHWEAIATFRFSRPEPDLPMIHSAGKPHETVDGVSPGCVLDQTLEPFCLSQDDHATFAHFLIWHLQISGQYPAHLAPGNKF